MIAQEEKGVAANTVATPRCATFYVVRKSTSASDIRWRVELPCRHLKAKLVSLTAKEMTYYSQHENDDEKFPWHLTEEAAEYPAHEGTAVWVRPGLNRAVHAAAMSANGILTVAEVDDNFISPKEQNIFMRINGYDTLNRFDHLRAFVSFDRIVFSTRKLRDIYAKAFRKTLHASRLPEMHVCRNHVDPDDWAKRIPILPPSDGRLRIGWMGSHQHVWDLRLAAPALRLAYDLGCEIVFVGLDPGEGDPAWRKFLPEFTYVPWQKGYHKKWLNFDIGLIPLVQNVHTDGKSDVKFLEYAMSGVATVAQSSPIYNQTIIHGETGLLASGPDDMGEKMLHLIRHQRERQEMAKAAKQYVMENRTMQGNISEWREAIRS